MGRVTKSHCKGVCIGMGGITGYFCRQSTAVIFLDNTSTLQLFDFIYHSPFGFCFFVLGFFFCFHFIIILNNSVI